MARVHVLSNPRRAGRRGPPDRGEDRRHPQSSRRAVLGLDARAGMGRTGRPSRHHDPLGRHPRARTRTLAALVVGRHFQAQYVWGIQGVIAEEGIPRATVDAIRDEHSDGIAPEDLQIIDFTRQLLCNNRVEDSLAKAVMDCLGADEYVQLTTCIGYYCMLAMTVNGAELEPNPAHEELKV